MSCSDVFRSSNAPLAGTATRGEGYLFLPVAMRFWGEKALNESWTTQDNLSQLDGLLDLGVRVRLYDPIPGGPNEAIYYGKEAHSKAVTAITRSLSIKMADNPERPSVFICTHGKRDQCCALYGQAVFESLKRLDLVKSGASHVFRCSHLGGDRFAGSMIFFPSGSMYGSINAKNAVDIMQSELLGRVHHANYRGCVFEEKFMQLARYGLALKGLADNLDVDIELVSKLEQEDRTTIEVEFGDSRSRASLEFVARQFKFYSDCSAVRNGHMSLGTMLECL